MFLQHWGATVAEITAPTAIDHRLPDRATVCTRAITVGAPRAEVFPWLTQMGFGRAGWYSYDLVDNLGRRSARRLVPEWQVEAPGDTVPGGPVAFTVSVIEPPTAFAIELRDQSILGHRIDFVLGYDLRPVGTGATRLVSRAAFRVDGRAGRFVERWFLGPGDGVMVRRQLLGIAERAATRGQAPRTS